MRVKTLEELEKTCDEKLKFAFIFHAHDRIPCQAFILDMYKYAGKECEILEEDTDGNIRLQVDGKRACLSVDKRHVGRRKHARM